MDLWEDVEGAGNSDTMMIVMINDTSGIKIVSLYQDLSESQPGKLKKANDAYTYNQGEENDF